MRTEFLVVLCHPRPDSFNHAVAARAAETLRQLGGEVHYHDLYAEGFDPLLRLPELRRQVSFDEQVLAHTRELEASVGLVFVHPEWWGQPPALLKGWLDRVLRPGVAYELEGEEFMPKRPQPLLGGRQAAVFCTTDSIREHAESGGQPPLLQRIWQEGVFRYCGIERGEVHIFYDLRRSSPAQRTDWLHSVERTAGRLVDAARP
jgi:NAD(P)H dehydrogenase (quinone)